MLTTEDKMFITRALAMHANLTRGFTAADFSVADITAMINGWANRPAGDQTSGAMPPSTAPLPAASSETT